MHRKSLSVLKPEIRYNEYNKINVWVSKEERVKILKHKLITDKNFKLTSTQTNPLYKPAFDELDAQAQKILHELDASVLWSRKYQKHDFKHFFVWPLFFTIVAIYFCINRGVKYRVYNNYIKYGRRLDIAERLDIDLDDIESYPKEVFEFYQEQKRKEAHLKRKDDKITSIEEHFHTFVEKRACDLATGREKKGLRTGRGVNPVRKPDHSKQI